MNIELYWIKIKDILDILWNNKKYILILILIFLFVLISFPVSNVVENNITYHHSVIDLGFADYGFSSAIIVGLLGFLATIYTNDKNLKVMKLSLIPEKTLFVKTEIENLLVSYYSNQKYHPPDQILLLIDILHIKSEYDTIFRLLAPKSYIRLNYLFKDLYEDWVEFEDMPERNARKIMSEILRSISHEKYHIEDDRKIIVDSEKFTYIEAKKRCKNQFQFPINDPMPLTDLSECNDDFEVCGKHVEFCMNTQQILEYIDTMPASKSRKLVLEKFKKMTDTLDEIFKDLKKEISVFEV